ncbi:MAG: ABC transporter ATP-binding protein [Nitriliruptoraceae bacterium]
MTSTTAASRRSFGQIAGLRLDPTRPAITVSDVTETFRLYHERPSGLKERLYRLRRAAYTDFNALEAVSFTIGHGESVAVIGHNGSGKSTLLKLLAKILPPDAGTVETNGMVASLLELGAGFHGDLTGRENIYLNGAILGLSRGAIDERFDEIVDFAGIRPLLDTAVRTYSSGLYVRLGFAIAVTVDPDILLVDEVLAVGDVEFQQRSLERMQRFRRHGKTFVLVSHDLAVVREMCDRVIVLEQGKVAFDGPVDAGIDHYQRRSTAVGPLVEQHGPEQVRLQQVELIDAEGNPAAVIAPGAHLILRVCIQAIDDVETCSLGMTVSRADGTHLYELHTAWQGVGVGPLAAETEATVEFRFTANVLAGHYTVGAVVTDVDARQTLAVANEGVRFAVANVTPSTGLVELSGAASVTEGPARRLTERQPAMMSAASGDVLSPRRVARRRFRRGKHG